LVDTVRLRTQATEFSFTSSYCKSAGCAWSDADFTELLSFRRKSILTGDLNAKDPFWNSAVSNPSGEKLFHLFNVNKFEIMSKLRAFHNLLKNSQFGNCSKALPLI
jgi:hypothetical protein